MNGRLHEMDVKFLEKLNAEPQAPSPSPPGVDDVSANNHVLNAKNFESVREGDVVILPAFGATIQEMQLLDAK